MLQFYFLSILLNAVTGLVLLFADPSRREETVSRKIPEIAYDETFRLVLGILAGIAGFFKLLTVVRGDVPIVGIFSPPSQEWPPGSCCCMIFTGVAPRSMMSRFL